MPPGQKSKSSLATTVSDIVREGKEASEELIDYGLVEISRSGWLYLAHPTIWALLSKWKMLILTNRRFIITDMSMTLTPGAHVAFPLNQLKLVKDSRFFTRRHLTILFPNGEQTRFTFQPAAIVTGWRDIAELTVKTLSQSSHAESPTARPSTSDVQLEQEPTTSSKGVNSTPIAERLRDLSRLHGDGILTDEEYERKRRDLIDQL